MSRHDGVQQWPTITTVSESPRNAQVLWVGTDDGNLHVTRDGGANWKNVAEKVPGVPKGTYVSRVIASHHADGTAYVTFDGHRMNDFGIYVFMTADFGETWKDISSNLPRNNGIVNVIREHPKNADLLFVGTEYGAFASFDRGASWTRIKMGMPTVPVDDILIHPRDNDLIFGTHGRSIWVLDDITPLEQFNAKVMDADLFLFDIRPATTWRMWNHKGSTGHKIFLGQNPPYGALINFYLKKELAANERIRTMHDKDGREIRRIDCGGPPPAAPGGPGAGFGGFAAQFGQVRCDPKPGINRAVWNLREAGPQLDLPGGPGAGFGGPGAGQGPLVEPGEYTVKVAHVTLPQRAAGAQGPPQPPQTKWESSKKVTVEEDPRVEISAADRAARREALRRAQQAQVQVVNTQRMLVTLRTNLTQAQASWRGAGAPRIPENVRKAADELLKKIDEIYPNFANLPTDPQAGLGAAGPPLVQRDPTLGQRIGTVTGPLNSFTAAPTKWMLEEIEYVQGRIRELSEQVRKLINEDLANLNKMMREANINYIQPPAGAGGGPGRGGPGDEE
jgi:hypothetical protein